MRALGSFIFIALALGWLVDAGLDAIDRTQARLEAAQIIRALEMLEAQR